VHKRFVNEGETAEGAQLEELNLKMLEAVEERNFSA
jgi:hypothetical protein